MFRVNESPNAPAIYEFAVRDLIQTLKEFGPEDPGLAEEIRKAVEHLHGNTMLIDRSGQLFVKKTNTLVYDPHAT